jgi:hypothetical protein
LVLSIPKRTPDDFRRRRFSISEETPRIPRILRIRFRQLLEVQGRASF